MMIRPGAERKLMAKLINQAHKIRAAEAALLIKEKELEAARQASERKLDQAVLARAGATASAKIINQSFKVKQLEAEGAASREKLEETQALLGKYMVDAQEAKVTQAAAAKARLEEEVRVRQEALEKAARAEAAVTEMARANAGALGAAIRAAVRATEGPLMEELEAARAELAAFKAAAAEVRDDLRVRLVQTAREANEAKEGFEVQLSAKTKEIESLQASLESYMASAHEAKLAALKTAEAKSDADAPFPKEVCPGSARGVCPGQEWC